MYSIHYYLALPVRVVSCLGYAIFLMPISPLIIISTFAHSYPIHTPLVHLEKVHFLIIQAGPPTTFFAISFTAIIRLGLALEAGTECAHQSVIAPCSVDLLYNNCKNIE